MTSKSLILASLLVLSPGLAEADTVLRVQRQGEANLLVFVTPNKSDADACIYVTQSRSQAQGNPHVWFYLDRSNTSQANRKVLFVKNRSRATLKIYFVKFKSRAGPC